MHDGDAVAILDEAAARKAAEHGILAQPFEGPLNASIDPQAGAVVFEQQRTHPVTGALERHEIVVPFAAMIETTANILLLSCGKSPATGQAVERPGSRILGLSR